MMRYITRMVTTTGTWYWNGQEVNQYDQWKASQADAQHYQRRHLAERKAKQLSEAVGRLWAVAELCVIEAGETATTPPAPALFDMEAIR